MKIITITLKDMVTKDNENGDFEVSYENEETFPAALTNSALKRGKELGLNKQSLIQDVLGLAKIEQGHTKDLDDTRALNIIYLSLLSFNQKFSYSFEEFLGKYHYSLEESFDIYADLVESMMNGK